MCRLAKDLLIMRLLASDFLVCFLVPVDTEQGKPAERLWAHTTPLYLQQAVLLLLPPLLPLPLLLLIPRPAARGTEGRNRKLASYKRRRANRGRTYYFIQSSTEALQLL